MEEFGQRSILDSSNRFDFVIVINRDHFTKVDSRFRVEFIARIVQRDTKSIFVHVRLPWKLIGGCFLAVHDRMGILVYASFGRCLTRVGRYWT